MADLVTGTPTDDDRLAEAEAVVRAYAGWHIAPVRTESLTVHADGSKILVLPSLRVVDVTAVTRWGNPLDGWMVVGTTLYRRRRWPHGDVVVTLSHGYDEVPDLRPLVRSLAARGVTAGALAQVGGVRVATGTDGAPVGATLTAAERATVDPYRLAPRP